MDFKKREVLLNILVLSPFVFSILQQLFRIVNSNFENPKGGIKKLDKKTRLPAGKEWLKRYVLPWVLP